MLLKNPLSKEALELDANIRCHQSQMEGLLRQLNQACIQYAMPHHVEFYAIMLQRVTKHFELMQDEMKRFDTQIQKDTAEEAKQSTIN